MTPRRHARKLGRVEFTIPGAPMSPNTFRRLSTRERMHVVKAERTWGLAAAIRVRNGGVEPIAGPCRIQFTVHRRRLLDPVDNLPASCKHYIDGVCDALLPLGDGPDTPYTWLPVRQVKVRTAQEERVCVTVEVTCAPPGS